MRANRKYGNTPRLLFLQVSWEIDIPQYAGICDWQQLQLLPVCLNESLRPPVAAQVGKPGAPL